MHHRVTVCETCAAAGENPRGHGFADELRALFDSAGLPDVTVDTVACLNSCAEPTALSFRAAGKWAYLFANVDPTQDGENVLAFARLYLNSKDGEITDARSCGRLRHCLRGRIPAG